MLQRPKPNILPAAQTVLFSAGLLAATQALAGGLRAELAVSSAAYLPDEPLTVQVTLSNEGNLPVRMLPRGTPMEGLFSDALRVTHDGQEIAYLGPMVRRREPLPQDYIILAPGERRTVSLDLAQVYAVDQPGRYEVSWRDQEIEGTQAGAKGTGTLTVSSTSATFELLGFRDRPITKIDPMAAQASCTANQQRQLNQAEQAARRSASGAYQELAGTPQRSRDSATHYLTWFGTYDARRYQTVTSNFQKIAAATSRLTYNCTCKGEPSDTIAFVNKYTPYEVTLCKPFWDSPISNGGYSMAATLVHETSHFYAVAGTEDHIYFPSPSKQLAQTDPAKAAQNADNYAFFSFSAQ